MKSPALELLAHCLVFARGKILMFGVVEAA